MNPNLIAKLKSINPTEGEWRNYTEPDNFPWIMIGANCAFDTDDWNPDDCELITLAPAMRQELLKMEEEIAELRYKLDQYKSLSDLCSSEKGLCRVCGGDNCDSDSHK